MPSKCSIILIDQITKSDVDSNLEAAAVLMARMSDLPTAVILLAGTPPQDVPSLAAPLLVLAAASPLVHYRCALADQLTPATWTQLGQTTHSAACSLHGATLRVSYNIYEPYFSQPSSGQLSEPSGQIEEAYLRSFIANYHLDVHFQYADDAWGTLNRTTGMWSGVVGLVSIRIQLTIKKK